MGDLAIVTLEMGDELDGGPGVGVIAGGGEGEGGPERIAAEEPGEARAVSAFGRAITGDEAASEKWIIHEALEDAEARPVVGLLKAGVGQAEFDGVGKILAIVGCGFGGEWPLSVDQPVVGLSGFGRRFYRSGESEDALGMALDFTEGKDGMRFAGVVCRVFAGEEGRIGRSEPGGVRLAIGAEAEGVLMLIPFGVAGAD